MGVGWPPHPGAGEGRKLECPSCGQKCLSEYLHVDILQEHPQKNTPVYPHSQGRQQQGQQAARQIGCVNVSPFIDVRCARQIIQHNGVRGIKRIVKQPFFDFILQQVGLVRF